jgi:hypothetical protein
MIHAVPTVVLFVHDLRSLCRLTHHRLGDRSSPCPSSMGTKITSLFSFLEECLEQLGEAGSRSQNLFQRSAPLRGGYRASAQEPGSHDPTAFGK